MKNFSKQLGESNEQQYAPLTTLSSSATTDSLPVTASVRPTGVAELLVSALPIAPYPEDKLRSSSNTIAQVNLASTSDSVQHPPSHSGPSFFAGARGVHISGGTFVNVLSHTGEGQMKTPVLQKPNSSPFFTGRKDVLDKLEKIFVYRASKQLSLRQSCLLWGMGGIGKTQICLKFIEDMFDSFLHVFWIDASSQESITMSLKGVSNIPAAQASGVDGSVESALQWISCVQGEWLMVFDDTDGPSPEVVAKFIPPGNRGNLLITSRNHSMGRVIAFENSIEINEMDESDAVALLLKASNLAPLAEHIQAAKKIVIELGCIPLAVEQAGAYIEAGNCNINKYPSQFALHRQTLMSDGRFRGASNYDKTVYGTWDLSFKEIERRAEGQSTTENAQAAQAAILILQICAFYHHSNISEDIFQSAAEESREHVTGSKIARFITRLTKKLPEAMASLDHTLLALDNDGHWDDFIFGQGIGVLLSFSLIKRAPSSKILSVHPLVHCWSREKMSKSEQQRLCQIGSRILCCAITRKTKHEDYALRQLIFPHIKTNELYGSQLGLIKQYYDDRCNNFALVMSENGDWKNAEELRIRVVNMRKKILGAKHPLTLTSMGNLASIYSDQGKWNKAEQLQVQVMDVRKKLLGVEHPDTLITMGNLASTYSNQGRWSEAEHLGVQVMEMRRKLLGTEHPDTLISMGNLANTYRNQGRWNEAEHLGVQVMDMSKKLLGAEHPDTLTTMVNLANTYSNQGRWDEAEQLEIQVMNMRKKLLGAGHLHTLRTMGNLASTYSNQGRWNEAEQLEVQVIEMSKKLLGEKHPDTLTSMESLASIYYKQGRQDEAEHLTLEAMNTRKRIGRDIRKK